MNCVSATICVVVFLSHGLAYGQVQEKVALGGHCPVSAYNRKWVKGSEDHKLLFDGQRYLFSSAKSMEEFAASPFKYVPALGGDCIVCWATERKRVPGVDTILIRYTPSRLGVERVYLFPEPKGAFDLFQHAPERYATLDISDNRMCPITKKPGSIEYAVAKNGIWYFCSSQSAKTEFEERIKNGELTKK